MFGPPIGQSHQLVSPSHLSVTPTCFTLPLFSWTSLFDSPIGQLDNPVRLSHGSVRKPYSTLQLVSWTSGSSPPSLPRVFSQWRQRLSPLLPSEGLSETSRSGYLPLRFALASHSFPFPSSASTPTHSGTNQTIHRGATGCPCHSKMNSINRPKHDINRLGIKRRRSMAGGTKYESMLRHRRRL